jgi:hypothetical protein
MLLTPGNRLLDGPRKANQHGQRNLQGLGQRDEHIQRHGVMSRLDAVNRRLGHVGQRLLLEEEDLIYLAQLLAASPELPTLKPAIYPDDACYLAKRLVNYQQEAKKALTDIAANPLAYGAHVFTLVAGLAVGSSVTETVLRATYRGLKGRLGSAAPALARATVHEQVRALRQARGEVGHQQIPERRRVPLNRTPPASSRAPKPNYRYLLPEY